MTNTGAGGRRGSAQLFRGERNHAPATCDLLRTFRPQRLLTTHSSDPLWFLVHADAAPGADGVGDRVRAAQEW